MSDFSNSILIVDDNPMNVMLTSKILESAGYHVRTATSGQEGLRSVAEVLPSLILLDVSMPDMDGYQVCELLKSNEQWKEIPVIFLTANVLTEDVVRGFKTGAVDYITKPFKREELFVRVNTHIELAESRRKIVEMNYSRDKLYSIIAHDIRSPLSGILQTLDALDQGFIKPGDPEYNEIINHLNIRAKETHTLLNSLLQWTKIQTDGISLRPTFIELSGLVQSCVHVLQGIADIKQIKLSVQEGKFYAMCDEMSMHTVFRNLISNAVKFTPSGGKIHVAFDEVDAAVIVSIADTGVGMSMDLIEKVFVKDEHFSSLGTGNEQGSGLGLMLVKDFVKKNNARIDVESRLGEGTTFFVEIPKE
jgi:two-component system sensor histidine kinase/response regulator